jgi:N-acetylmuramoyl-L-alanine amidase
MNIGIDPGHGGKDPGAVGPTGGYEKDVNLAVALELRLLLEAAGHQVVITRTGDTDLSLAQRSNLLNAAAKCDLAISIHCNASTSPEPSYISTFIQGTGGEAEKLAKCIQPRLVATTGWPDGGIRVQNLHMTRETRMPAVLIELGFISNPGQEKQLADPTFRARLAGAIADGILAYTGANKKEEENSMFKDVPKGAWYAKVVDTAAKDGVVAGFPDGTFKPNEPLTRAQYAAIYAKQKFRDGIFSDILPEVMPSVVLVHTGPSLGSGACVAQRDGWSYIITNSHVVGTASSGFCVKDDATIPNFDWELWANDPTKDLAIIRTRHLLPPLGFAQKYELGEPVAAIGAPQGYTETVTVGILSNINRGEVLQIDAPISPGNSGGPCINERGEIVGVVTAKLVDVTVEGMAFVIRAEIAKKYVSDMLK